MLDRKKLLLEVEVYVIIIYYIQNASSFNSYQNQKHERFLTSPKAHNTGKDIISPDYRITSESELYFCVIKHAWTR